MSNTALIFNQMYRRAREKALYLLIVDQRSEAETTSILQEDDGINQEECSIIMEWALKRIDSYFLTRESQKD